jgi:hypothetical protein
MPDAITRLFKEAYDTFPPLEGKPTDNNLLAIQRTLLPLLMVIPYNQLGGTHSLVAILTEAAKYQADHGNKNLDVPNASLSTMIPSPTTPGQSSKVVQRQPTNPALTILPVTRQPYVALPNSYAMSLTRFGITFSKMQTFST